MSDAAPLTESTTGWVATEFNLESESSGISHVNLIRIGTTVYCQIRDSVTLAPSNSSGLTKGTIISVSPVQIPEIYRPVYDVFAPAWVLADNQEAMGFFFIGKGGQINFGLGANGLFEVAKTNGFFPISVSWAVAA